jgi:hypothetical protein
VVFRLTNTPILISEESGVKGRVSFFRKFFGFLEEESVKKNANSALSRVRVGFKKRRRLR